MSPTTRKVFLGRAAATGAALAGAGTIGVAPAVHAGAASPPRLSAGEAATLVAWCDAIVPGAVDVADFVNAQLRKSPADAFLSVRYFGVPGPWLPYYRAGLAGVEAAALAAFGAPLLELSSDGRLDLVRRLIAGGVPWTGPQPFFVFYLATRSDAVDVVYGTPRGYAAIEYPYVPQVTPPSPW